MSKKELYTGALLMLFLVGFFIGMVDDVPEYLAEVLPVIELGPGVLKIVGWVVTIYALGMLALTVWAVIKRNEAFKQIIQKATYRATIPGYFIVAFVPVICGLILILIGLEQWGMMLSCTGFPAMLIFALLAIGRRKSE